VALARADRDINHVIAYGQSLSSGCEGWPALSTEQAHDSLMLGDAVRPRKDDSIEWSPVGTTAFRPLRATVQEWPPGAVALGETVLEGAANFWRGRQLAVGASPGRHRLLARSCGVGGRTLEALSKGASPELFPRLRGCARLARATADARGLSCRMAAAVPPRRDGWLARLWPRRR